MFLSKGKIFKNPLLRNIAVTKYYRDEEKLYIAIYNTFKRRNTLALLGELNERFNIISDSLALREYWHNY